MRRVSSIERRLTRSWHRYDIGDKTGVQEGHWKRVPEHVIRQCLVMSSSFHRVRRCHRKAFTVDCAWLCVKRINSEPGYRVIAKDAQYANAKHPLLNRIQRRKTPLSSGRSLPHISSLRRGRQSFRLKQWSDAKLRLLGFVISSYAPDNLGALGLELRSVSLVGLFLALSVD